MRVTILPELAMVCLRAKCAVIFEGPDKTCPACGWQGATYREIEAMALSAVLGTIIEAPKPPQPITQTIQ
jgi:hypothetical protein